MVRTPSSDPAYPAAAMAQVCAPVRPDAAGRIACEAAERYQEATTQVRTMNVNEDRVAYAPHSSLKRDAEVTVRSQAG